MQSLTSEYLPEITSRFIKNHPIATKREPVIKSQAAYAEPTQK
jgi:hypothetical protein